MKKSFVMAAATVFAAGTLVASVASAQTPQSPAFGNDSLACKGINACKGQGWVQAKSRLDCQAAGGSNASF
jgi:hypothetical protein